MVSIAQNANGSRFHHHGEFKVHRIAHPALDEGTKDVTMGDLDSRESASIIDVAREGNMPTTITSGAEPPSMNGSSMDRICAIIRSSLS